MGYQRIQLGSSAILFAQLSGGETNLFPVAVVRNAAGAEVSGSPFSLAHVADGLYSNVAFVPVLQGNYIASYAVYTDLGHTTLSTYPRVSDSIEVTVPPETACAEISGIISEDSSTSPLIGIIQDDEDFLTGIIDDSI